MVPDGDLDVVVTGKGGGAVWFDNKNNGNARYRVQ